MAYTHNGRNTHKEHSADEILESLEFEFKQAEARRTSAPPPSPTENTLATSLPLGAFTNNFTELPSLPTTPTMADPFEVRMRFTNLLSHLNASTNSAHKAAHYALRFSAFAEDLHSCILEQLERNNLNSRANIMYFLPALCDAAKAQEQMTYVRMMERDILRIVDLVAPAEGGGAANVRVVRSVLKALESKGFLQSQTVGELEEFIAGRDGGGPESPNGAAGAGEAGQPEGASFSAARNTPASVREQPYAAPAVRLDKRQIEQRIEEDRERHKRAREGIWAVKQDAVGDLGEDRERDDVWDQASDLEEDDLELAREEAEQRQECLRFERA